MNKKHESMHSWIFLSNSKLTELLMSCLQTLLQKLLKTLWVSAKASRRQMESLYAMTSQKLAV